MVRGKLRKTKYNDDFPLLVEGYAREGLTDEQIAQKIGICIDTFYRYIQKYSEFSESLKRGKAPVDIQVENALLKRALGYNYEEVKEDYVTTKTGEEILRNRTVTKKHVQPDVTAQIFWLKNRKPAEWRDKKDIELEWNVNIHEKAIDSSDNNNGNNRHRRLPAAKAIKSL